jgi:hypothetical protein
MPKALAGALIGRIDGGRPFGIGDQTSIVGAREQLVVPDNIGQFHVVISW